MSRGTSKNITYLILNNFRKKHDKFRNTKKCINFTFLSFMLKFLLREVLYFIGGQEISARSSSFI